MLLERGGKILANQFKKTFCVAMMTGLIGSTTIMTLPDSITASASSGYTLKNGKLISTKTKKTVKGYKFYKSTLYKNGTKYTGTYKGLRYKSGKKFNGAYKGIRYKSGKKLTGAYKGIQYINSQYYTGTKSGITYKAGKVVSATNVNKVDNTAIVYVKDQPLLKALNDLLGRNNLTQNITVADLRSFKGTLFLNGDTDERETFGMFDIEDSTTCILYQY